MHTLIDLINQLNSYLQISQFIDFAPNGLQIEGREKIKRVVTAVTASQQIIHKAIELEADVLIVHHGLFWDKDPYIIQGAKREKIAQLLKHGISLLAYHLPLDAHQEIGNNWKAAYDLGWRELQPFFLLNGQFIGVRGTVTKQPREAFQKSLEEYYGHPATIAFGGKKNIESVALISGGAYKQITDAIALKLDAYVTGNFDLPAWDLAHEGNGINFYAVGHAATEKSGPRALADYLRRVHNLDAHFIDEINPF